MIPATAALIAGVYADFGVGGLTSGATFGGAARLRENADNRLCTLSSSDIFGVLGYGLGVRFGGLDSRFLAKFCF